RLTLAAATGETVFELDFAPEVDVTNWLGAFALRDIAGGALPLGAYEARVETSVGRLVAAIDVVPPGALRGRSVSEATSCGVTLRAYRLVSEADTGERIELRVGDRLMVILSGNPTTGYVWENVLTYEYAVLRETEELGFRSDSEALGSGGFFVFRYTAIDLGPQGFRFEYHRPWESVQPLEVVEFSVDVV
ncbi:MAG: protease inhibitor I42 family protein, partial [Candidatus Bipolaricaulota bacterium]